MDLLKLYEDEGRLPYTLSGNYSADSPRTHDPLEEQLILPRIGDEYQVEIPPLERRPGHEKNEYSVYLGQQFPVISDIDRDRLENTSTSSSISSTHTNEMIATNNWTISVSPTAWTSDEEKIFLLGLYIFEKNLVQVMRFMECKKMGEILSFYYGKFYRSAAHRRWSASRKIRTRRHVYGQRIFSGWRLNELMQRLDQNLSDECRNTMFEVTRALTECRVSFEDYIFVLKAAVGINALVNAVGIGIKNYDLTGILSDPTKAAHRSSARAEIPAGKACSSLAPGDIIKFLTGDFRLSKAKSNDLFWEAVWPRLLAKGWHSEQPKDFTFTATSRHPSLVFLLPAIKKFSRKLVKGKHYFDSITDVLNRVVSNPRLLELDLEASLKAEEKDDLVLVSPDLMRFTVVDTSAVNTGVRQLRSLPIDSYLTACRNSDSDAELETSSSSEDEKPEPDLEKLNCQNGFKPKKCKPNYLSPVLKRQRLTACENPESVFLALAASEKAEEPKRTTLIDLNLPEFPPDFDSCEMEEKQPIWVETTEVSRRRQSTRNRPLTARALEALASGFLATGRKEKGNTRVSGRGKSIRASGNSDLVEIVHKSEEYSSQC